MTNLDQLLKDLCPEGVERKPLEECCEILDKRRKPVTKSDRKTGQYPYYGANGIQDYVSDYIFDGTFVLVGEDGSVITEAGTPVVTWAEGKIWVNNHAHIISEKEGVMLRYLYHYLQTVEVSAWIHGNIPKFTGADFRAVTIPVPPLEIQREIVRILDNFTELTAELTAELEARKKQYEYYRDKLLTFEDEVGGQKTNVLQLLFELCPNGVEYKTTAEIKIDSFWLMPATPNYEEFGVPYITSKNVKNGKIDFSDVKYISEEDYKWISSNRSIQKNDLLITMIGTIGEAAFVGDFTEFYGQNMYLVRLNEEVINRKFYYYYLTSARIKDGLVSKKNASSQGYIKAGSIENLKIPVPPLEAQRIIVSILDRFDTLCNDISSGLPAEIEGRRRQYEYYRDKLLSFKEM